MKFWCFKCASRLSEECFMGVQGCFKDASRSFKVVQFWTVGFKKVLMYSREISGKFQEEPFMIVSREFQDVVKVLRVFH